MFIARSDFGVVPSARGQPLAFVEQFSELQSCAEVTDRLQELVVSYGFDTHLCMSVPEAGQDVLNLVLASTRPAVWLDEYAAGERHNSDPLIRAAARRIDVFGWQEVLSRESLSASEREVVALAERHGMQDGLVVPVFESNGGLGLVSISGSEPDLSRTTRTAISLAAIATYNRLCALRRKNDIANTRLTQREAEVLHWIAAGKSDWQIGQILAISAKTVNYHVENVKRKYRVATRVQAVVAALRQGKICP